MKVLLPCSIGEAIDRYLILLKKQEVATGGRHTAITTEVADLRAAIDLVYPKATCDLLMVADIAALDRVNRALWDLEDQIRVLYKSGFIHTDTAYKVCQLNDERSRLKQNINMLFGSAYYEFKQYG